MEHKLSEDGMRGKKGLACEFCDASKGIWKIGAHVGAIRILPDQITRGAVFLISQAEITMELDEHDKTEILENKLALG